MITKAKRTVRVSTSATTQAMAMQRLANEERKAALAWGKVLQAYGADVAKDFSTAGIASATATLAKHTKTGLRANWIIAATTFAKASFQNLAGTTKAFVHRTTTKARRKPKPTPENWRKVPTLVEAYIADHVTIIGVEKIKSISTTQRDIVKRIVIDGTNGGKTITDISAEIHERYSRNGVKADAMRIARTETHGAAMAGVDVGARATGLDYVKEWSAAVDERTRPSHAAADGQQVDKDDAFTVDGEDLMFPGDPSGSAANVINCRCTYLTEPI